MLLSGEVVDGGVVRVDHAPHQAGLSLTPA
jgi:hypothetical protein